MDHDIGSVVILGGTSGIGLANARQLSPGYRVTIAGRDRRRLKNALADLGALVTGHVVDATDRAALEDFYGRVAHFDHLAWPLPAQAAAARSATWISPASPPAWRPRPCRT